MQALAIISTPAAAQTLDQQLEDFAAYIDVKPASLATYLNGIRQFWAWIQEQGRMAGREALLAWREHLQNTCKPSTTKIYMSSVKRFLSWASTSGRLDKSVSESARTVKAPRIDKNFKKDCLTELQARELLESVNTESLTGKRDYALLALMLTCGLRDIEVSRARICDLQVVAGQSALAVMGKGKDGYDAYVKIAAPVEKAIRAYLKERNETDQQAPLFTSVSNRNANNLPLTTRSISRIVKGHMQAIGLNSDRLTAHSLRHTAATLNLLNGGTLEETQALLRHTSITTTQIYAHHITWAGRQAENRIADKLF